MLVNGRVRGSQEQRLNRTVERSKRRENERTKKKGGNYTPNSFVSNCWNTSPSPLSRYPYDAERASAVAVENTAPFMLQAEGGYPPAHRVRDVASGEVILLKSKIPFLAR
jgi:hypothetical protein